MRPVQYNVGRLEIAIRIRRDDIISGIAGRVVKNSAGMAQDGMRDAPMGESGQNVEDVRVKLAVNVENIGDGPGPPHLEACQAMGH